MNEMEKSELVIARILNLLLVWGIQHTSLKFDELELEQEYATFFYPCLEWLESEGLIRVKAYNRTIGGHAGGSANQPVLTSYGMTVLGQKIIANGDTEQLSEGVKKVSSGESSLWQVGDAIGGILGRLTKSLGS
jgi:hypothetical protein